MKTYATLLTALFLCLAPLASARTHLNAGDALPKLELPNTKGSTSDTFKGHPLIVIYLRPNHKYSIEAMVEIDQVLKRYEKQGVQCLAVSNGSEAAPEFVEIMKKKLKSKRITFVIDSKDSILAKLGIMVSPTTMVFDKDLKLRHRLPQISPTFARNLHAHLRLVLGMIDQKTHDEILATTGAEQRYQKNHHDAKLAVARELIVAGRDAKAIEHLDKLLKNPLSELPQLQALKCIALLNLDKGDDAKPLISAVTKSEDASLEVAMAKVRIAFQQGGSAAAGKALATVKPDDWHGKRVVAGLGRLPAELRGSKDAKAYGELIKGKVK